MYKIPADIAEKSFTFTETEKARLAAPTARVINKYAATWMVQFKDEIALAMLFVTMTAVKLQMATALTNMRGAASPTPAPARPVSTIRVEPSAQDLDAAELENSIREKTQGA
jgi:hypothetical protein